MATHARSRSVKPLPSPRGLEDGGVAVVPGGPRCATEGGRSKARRAWPGVMGRDLTAQLNDTIEGILFTEEGSMAAFVKVAHVGDVPPGKMLAVTLDGQPVVLVNVGGAMYAFGGICTHADGPLGKGKLRGGVVECPFHGGQFEVQTGKAVMPPATEDIPTFEVRIVGDDIHVALP